MASSLVLFLGQGT